MHLHVVQCGTMIPQLSVDFATAWLELYCAMHREDRLTAINIGHSLQFFRINQIHPTMVHHIDLRGGTVFPKQPSWLCENTNFIFKNAECFEFWAGKFLICFHLLECDLLELRHGFEPMLCWHCVAFCVITGCKQQCIERVTNLIDLTTSNKFRDKKLVPIVLNEKYSNKIDTHEIQIIRSEFKVQWKHGIMFCIVRTLFLFIVTKTGAYRNEPWFPFITFHIHAWTKDHC